MKDLKTWWKLKESRWTTQDELSFLDNLGHHSTVQKPAEDLLEGYKAGSILRTKWGEVDRFAIAQKLGLLDVRP